MIVATSDAGRGVWSVFICALVLCSAVRGAAQEAELVSGWRFPEGGDAKVKSADGKDGDLFGASAAVCGSYAYVGTPNDRMNGLTMGSVYSYKLTGSAWRLSDKLYPSELGSDGDQFGSSVACHRNTTAVGAPLDGSLFEGGGAVYVYIRTLAGIELSAKLTSYSGEVNENFGHSVAVSHDLVLVGAIGSSEAGDGSGVVYAFRRDRPQTDDFLDDDGAAQDDLVADGWSIEAIIFPADVNSYDSFGYSLAVSGSVIVVGSPNADGRRGAVYVFNRTLVYSEQDDELYTADKTVPSYLLLKRLTAGEGTVSREFFGRSVAVHEHTIAVGQPLAFDDTYDSQPGAAHVFTTHTSGQNLFSWTHVAILKEPVWPRKQNQFGGSVAVMENTVLVGAPGGPYYANPTVYEFGRYHVHAARRSLREAGGGSAYLTGGDEFSYWSDQAVLVPSDRSEMQGKGVSNDAFGSAVAIGELGIAVMGAPNTLGGRGEPSGAVYVYRGSHVSGGGAGTDDDPEPVGGEQGEAVEARRVNKSLAWLVVLLVPACALGVCFFMQRRKRRRHRAAGPSTSGGRSYGEGSGAAPDYFDTATEISDLDSEMSFRDIRGRVKNRLSMLSSHAKDWIDNAVQNPIYLSKGDSVYSDDSRGDGMDDSTGSSTGRSFLWRFGGQGGGGAAKYREVSAARPKRSTQQVLATARAVANDMSHPNQEEVAVLLRTHEKDWITEEKFMETLEELVY